MRKLVFSFVVYGVGVIAVCENGIGMEFPQFENEAANSIRRVNIESKSLRNDDVLPFSIDTSKTLSYDTLQETLRNASLEKFNNNFKKSLEHYTLAFLGNYGLYEYISKKIENNPQQTDGKAMLKQIISQYEGEREAVKSIIYLCRALYGESSSSYKLWGGVARKINVVVK